MKKAKKMSIITIPTLRLEIGAKDLKGRNNLSDMNQEIFGEIPI